MLALLQKFTQMAARFIKLMLPPIQFCRELNQLVFGIACFGSCVLCLLSCLQAISQSVTEIARGEENVVGVLVQQ